jgi:asparaginyl-tRNA synthetase
MRGVSVKKALSQSGPVSVAGWVRSVRRQKRVAFVSVFDGSSARDLQVVVDPEKLPASASVGASVSIGGVMKESPGKGQANELHAERVTVTGGCPEDYALQKKEHSDEFLREIGHLRPRTSAFAAVMRLRHGVGRALTRHLDEEGFVQIHCPVLVSGDCEGAGEMFRVSDSAAKSNAAPFFGVDAFLTVSAQLHGEVFASGMSRVYSFGPTFRAERHSKTVHHLAEFWMLEPEFAFADMGQLVALAEGTVRAGLTEAIERHGDDLETIGRVKSDVLQRYLQKPFVVMSYTEAVEALQRAATPFVKSVEWGMDLQREHERYLCETHTGGVPVFVTDYPAAIKPFYAKTSLVRSDCAQAVDLLVPGIGEVIGGSVREDDADVLRANMAQRGMQSAAYEWYVDLRKYGSGHTAGFGLGFERFLQWSTGTANIRDVSPVPRWAGHIRL